MAIQFREDTKQFYLHTRHTSYVMEVYAGILAHTYWGGPIDAAPKIDALFPYVGTNGFSSSDIPQTRFNSSDRLPQEYPTYGSADLRQPAFRAVFPDGSSVTRFRYHSYRILAGKPSLPGLPATYAGDDECESLEITLADEFTGIHAVLLYSIFPEKDVLTRSVRIENHGDRMCRISNVASCCMDLHDSDYQMIHLSGAWARERHIVKTDLTYCDTMIDSKRGASSHNHNPFFALTRPHTTEVSGEAMGFCFVYSGNFSAGASVDQNGTTRVHMGINPFGFSWALAPGESFQAPEVIMVYSDAGLGEMTRRFHRILRKNLCRGKYRDGNRPILINNWEATYFDFNEEKILRIAEKARDVGVELMVLDDGWFGKRDIDNCSLGDWVENPAKLPEGLSGLARKVNDLGMKFGVWFEPEMVSPDSDLYRAHPDWCIHTDGRGRTEGRNQLILDLSRPEVCDYIIDTLSGILSKAPISYIKWDMNRNMTESSHPEQPHRYMLGLYRILETLASRFPDVLFESCSGGGGRFDAGMHYYMPQAWTSDDTDAVERLYIQEGTSLIYPLSTMGAHVSAVPNHQVGRVTPIAFRSQVAMMGTYGFELDLNKLTDEELETVRQEIAFCKQWQHTIHSGDFYRLRSAYGSRCAAYQVISEDSSTAMVFVYTITGQPQQAPCRVKLQGLEPDSLYEDENGTVSSGACLMRVGIPVSMGQDMQSVIHIFKKK